MRFSECGLESDSKFKYNSCSQRLEPNSEKMGTLIRAEVTYSFIGFVPSRTQGGTNVYGWKQTPEIYTGEGPVQLTCGAKTFQYEPP